MKIRRRLIALSVATLVASTGLLAQEKKDKKTEEMQKREAPAAVKMVDDAAAGQAGANDLALTWVREDFLKAQGNKEYVPFTVSVDASKFSGNQVALYWRVVSKDPAAAAPAADKDKKKDDKDKKSSKFAYEDISFPTVVAGKVSTMSRSFTVGAGNYDVYVLVKELTPEKPAKNAPPLKSSLLKQAITVPDFWNGDLATSTVIVARQIDPLPAPLTPQQQSDRPYALGAMEIQPQFDLKLTKKSELSTFMLIYNPKVDAGNKPDVTVEYNFYQTAAGQPEKFFNKTSPQALNATTLPPQFDMAQGHQLQSGQAVPLASFPEGEYRLEIKVTDKLANKTLTNNVKFSVSGS